MNTLITGGAGFIGSNLALKLESQGYKITIIDNLSSGNKKNLAGFKGNFIKKDIATEHLLNKKFDAIFHLASITDTTVKDSRIMKKNIEGFKNILKMAYKNNSRLIYASSASVYGNGKIPMKEGQKLQPLNLYAKSKMEIDSFAQMYFGKMHIVGLRYFNVFGPKEEYKGKMASMVLQLTNQILDGRKVRLFEFGEQKRDFVYINDVIEASLKAMKAKKSGIYNVGTGKATTFNHLVNLLSSLLGVDCRIEYFKNPITKLCQVSTQADLTNSKKYLNYHPSYDLKDALKDYLAYIRQKAK